MTAAKKVAAPSPRKAGPATRTGSAAKKAPTKAPTKTATKAKAGTAKKGAAAPKGLRRGQGHEEGHLGSEEGAPARPRRRRPRRRRHRPRRSRGEEERTPGQGGGTGTAPRRPRRRRPPPRAWPRRPRSGPRVGPYAKDAKFFEEQRALLLEERAIYSGQAVDLRAEADSLALEREPGDVQFDEESGEGGTVTVDRERNLALSAQASAAVEEIDDALRKIDRKSYGGCERCHQPIPKARLRALPFARLCVACKSGGLSRR